MPLWHRYIFTSHEWRLLGRALRLHRVTTMPNLPLRFLDRMKISKLMIVTLLRVSLVRRLVVIFLACWLLGMAKVFSFLLFSFNFSLPVAIGIAMLIWNYVSTFVTLIQLVMVEMKDNSMFFGL